MVTRFLWISVAVEENPRSRIPFRTRDRNGPREVFLDLLGRINRDNKRGFLRSIRGSFLRD